MDNFWSKDFSGVHFELFGKVHIITLVIFVIFNLSVIIMLKKQDSIKLNNIFRVGMALFMIIIDIGGTVFTIYTNSWTLKYSLPLHLCDATVILSIITLLSKNRHFYDIVYFWGLSGTLQAVITPDLEYNFPHFMYFYYYILHGLIITTVLYMTFIEKYRPIGKSILKVIIIANIYAGIISVVNLFLGSNYMYLCGKPLGTTVMNYLGEWPWYILSLEAIAIISFLFYYIPFFIFDIKQKF